MTWRIAVLLACCAVAAGCAGDLSLGRDLRSAITAAEDNGAVLDLAEVVDGDWDRLTVVCPYEDADFVTERLGFEWDDFPGEDLSESRVLYVFSTDDEVVTWAQLSRADGDACTTDGHVLPALDRTDARFNVVADGETIAGDRFLRLLLAD